MTHTAFTGVNYLPDYTVRENINVGGRPGEFLCNKYFETKRQAEAYIRSKAWIADQVLFTLVE